MGGPGICVTLLRLKLQPSLSSNVQPEQFYEAGRWRTKQLGLGNPQGSTIQPFAHDPMSPLCPAWSRNILADTCVRTITNAVTGPNISATQPYRLSSTRFFPALRKRSGPPGPRGYASRVRRPLPRHSRILSGKQTASALTIESRGHQDTPPDCLGLPHEARSTSMMT